MIISPAYAQDAAGAGGIFGALLPFLLIFVVFYFLLIRPQQKRAKDHKNLLKELKKGDEVVTNGGVIGKITAVDESFAEIEVSSGVSMKVQKQGINQKMPKGSVKPMTKATSKSKAKTKAIEKAE